MRCGLTVWPLPGTNSPRVMSRARPGNIWRRSSAFNVCAANAVAVADLLLDRLGRTGIVALPDMHLTGGSDQVAVQGVAEQVAPAGQCVAVQRAHRIGYREDALQPAGLHPLQQPRQGAREIGRTHRERTERIAQPARYLAQHARHGDRCCGVGAEHAGIAERRATGGAERIQHGHLHAGTLQIECGREADDAGADDQSGMMRDRHRGPPSSSHCAGRTPWFTTTMRS